MERPVTDGGLAPYVGLGAAATAYAVLLNTSQGREFAKDYTWATVVIGTGLVLGTLRPLMPVAEWNKVVLAFTIAGIPMVGRSLVNKARS